MLKHCLVVFGVSMVPLIELRGAIPYGVAFGLPLWLTYIIAIVGNMLPVPIIYFFARKILIWGRNKRLIGPFSPGAWKKAKRAEKSSRKKPGEACSGRCCCLSASRFREPAPGRVLWRPACWIWALRRACWPAWAASCWPALSWASFPCWVWASSRRRPHNGSKSGGIRS